MPWLQAHLTVDKGRAPLIELLFEELGALSVSLLDASDEPMLEPAPGEQPLWSHTRVSGLFDAATDADELRSRIDQTLNADLSRQLELEVLEDRAWERAWLERFRPMRFGRRLWVCPHGQDPGDDQANDAVIVRLDPGLAFGTGTHPTTALCLQWLDRAATDRPDLAGARVIDFGCGSGILAIAAAKLGAAEVIAVDHDPQAVLATCDNAERNGVAERIRALHSNAFEPEPADLVLANILSNVLVERAAQLTALVANPGQLVLSGILAEQADGVASAFAPTINFQAPQTHDGWVLLAGRHRID
jgi:ribosomal protein L11 methyltransferase